MPDRLRRGAPAAVLLLIPNAAAAHSPIPGIEGFYWGLLHPLSTPGQILAILAVGLLAGGFFPRFYGVLAGAFALLFLIGLRIGDPIALAEPALAASAMVAAVLAALAPDRALALAVVVLAITGLGFGMASAPDDGPARDRIITMAGSTVGANVLLLYLSALTGLVRARLRWSWTGVALRIVAAWVAAVAAMMTALAVAGTG